MQRHERLREIVERSGVTQGDFAAQMGVAVSAQRNYEKGLRKPDIDYLQRLYDAGYDVMYLLTGETEVPDGFVRVPKMKAVGSMGFGLAEAPQHEYAIEQTVIMREWLWKNLPTITSVENLRLITGHGDSMQGTYEDGDTLFVDIGVKSCQTEGIYIFEMEREIFIKRLQRLPKGRIEASSDNPVYKPFIIDSYDNFHILGKIVGSWNLKKH
nr:MAG TPA: Repressor protein CI [Caudoviricetes sp.]